MNTNRITQATKYLLSMAGRPVSYKKLIKLLYIADKQAIAQTNSSITDDSYCSMKYGPVLIGLHSLIKERNPDTVLQAEWDSNFIKDGDNISIRPDSPLSMGLLCENDKDLISAVEKEFHDYSEEQIIAYVHDKIRFPEWENPEPLNKKEIPISFESILASVGRMPEEIQYILNEKKSWDDEDLFFREACS